MPLAPAQAQGAAPKVPIKVAQTSLPVTVGVPLGESANVMDAGRLVLLDPTGQPVPAQTRVLARWRGAATNTGAAIKWVLVDFKPTAAGTYTLSSAGNAPAASGVTTSDLGTSLRVASSRVTLDFAKGGASLVTSFKLDGAEQLKAPLTIEGALPRGAVVALVNSSDTLTVSETGMLKVGDTVRFAHTTSLIWAANAGDTAFFSINQMMQGNRTYRLEEGTPRQEDVLVSAAENGKLTVSGALRYAHAAGTPVRDLTAEQETAIIKSISGQVVAFIAPLRQQHVISDSFSVADAAPVSAFATIERTAIEEQGALRTVILQQGHFTSSAFGGNVVDPSLKFTVRYYIYADQPFVRVRFQLMNEGPFGFGAWRRQSGVFSQHLLIRRITASVPTVAAGAGGVLVVDREDAYTRSKARWAGPTVTAGAMELSVPEFAENYPKGVAGDGSGLRFDVMPDRGFDYVFDGARAKTTDFYLGKQTATAMGLTDQLPGVVDPAYIATTGAVRPLFVEKRNWTQVFSGDAEMAEAATRAERWLAVGYDVGSSDENWRIPATSIFEYRWRDESGANLGWRNFGDFAWGDGYCNQHYDIPYTLMREFARTGDARAFQTGSQLARYRADWGQYHADDYWDSDYNMRGFAFYEKAEHGSDRMPQPTHSWSEGLWLYWAMTGDESVHAAAVEAADAEAKIVDYGYMPSNALYNNESRWVGWPAFNLIAAYRYTGDARYLSQCQKAVYMLVQAEEDAGRKGYYLSPANPDTRPWMWAGYSALGAIEYYRETGDQRTADYLVRQAEWLLGKRGDYPVLVGGTNVNGQYQPFAIPYSWAPGKPADTPMVELGQMVLPTMTAAARITGRADFRDAARRLFRDVAFYRDFGDGPLDPATRAPISFRSHQYGASSPKVYGHTGLVLSDYIPDLIGSLVKPGQTTLPPNATPTPVPNPTPTPTPTPTLAPVVTLLTPTAGTPLIIGQPVRFSWSLNTGAVATKFQLRLSTDGGANYATLIAEVPGGATEYTWTIPTTYSNQRAAQVRFQIVATDALNRTGMSASPSNLRFAGQLAAVNAASYKTALAPGALVSAFGTVMATQANGQPDSQYVIKGTHVDLVDGAGKSTPCPLFYAGSVPGGGYDQVNFHLPDTVAVGQATITITSGTGEISQSVVTLDQVAPAVFTTSANGAGEAATLSTTDGINYFNGVKQVPNADVYVSMFGTGWRFANLVAGLAAPGSPLPLNYEAAAAPVVVEVNGSPVEVTYAGPQMTFLGLDQINFKLPRTLAAGTYSIVVKIGTRVSSTVQLRVQ